MKKSVAALVVLAIILGLCACGKTSESLTLSAISRQFDNTIYEKYTVAVGENEYIETVDVLSEMLIIDEWKEIDKPDDEMLLLKIHLSELYEIYLYESYARVYYGYASMGEVENAYYSIPAEVSENIQTYIETISV